MKKYVYAIIGGFITFLLCTAFIMGVCIVSYILLINIMEYKQLYMTLGIILIIFAGISGGIIDKVYQTIKKKYQ